LNGDFAPWVGALITDIKHPILLVAPEGKEEEAVTRLSRVGYDNTIGYLKGGIKAWKAVGKQIDSISSFSAEKFAQKLKDGKVDQLLDVRRPSEFLSQHLTAAENFPLDYINSNMNRLNKYDTYYLHCAGGYRSMIAASILKARGFDNLVNIEGGWKSIEETDAPKTNFVCPTTMSQETVDAAVAEFI